MFKNHFLLSFLAFSLVLAISPAHSSEGPEGNRIFGVVQKMELVLKGMEDYSCEVEQFFYQNGVEDQHYRFKFYFKRKKKIRVDFSYPYSSLTILYQDGDQEATVIPLRFMPAVRFRFSLDNSMIKTHAGQRIDQTDIGYFLDFMLKNLKNVKQGEDEFYEDGGQVTFLFWAKDYIEEKSDEKYRISISKKHWLPIRIERYSLGDRPLEKTEIKNYAINTQLKDKFFNP
jgi:outer membrane lipoprotein-sorting protein